MKMDIPRKPRLEAWTVFELLCFVAAFTISFCLADLVNLQFHNQHHDLIIYIFLFIIGPLLGFAFCLMLYKFARFLKNRTIQKHQTGKKGAPNSN